MENNLNNLSEETKNKIGREFSSQRRSFWGWFSLVFGLCLIVVPAIFLFVCYSESRGNWAAGFALAIIAVICSLVMIIGLVFALIGFFKIIGKEKSNTIATADSHKRISWKSFLLGVILIINSWPFLSPIFFNLLSHDLPNSQGDYTIYNDPIMRTIYTLIFIIFILGVLLCVKGLSPLFDKKP